jgi:hypothetical protein
LLGENLGGVGDGFVVKFWGDRVVGVLGHTKRLKHVVEVGRPTACREESSVVRIDLILFL